MASPTTLLANNRAWADRVKASDPEFFERLAEVQRPDYLWLGCSDSRVPATLITGLKPGDMFVHRNVGNNVIHADLNVQSVIQFAVDALGVKHVIVCGHYGCGAVAAAMGDMSNGLLDNWLLGIRALHETVRERLEKRQDAGSRQDLMCELNVWSQVRSVSTMPVVRKAWERGSGLEVHGWIYDIRSGLLKDLELDAGNAVQADGLAGRLDTWF